MDMKYTSERIKIVTKTAELQKIMFLPMAKIQMLLRFNETCFIETQDITSIDSNLFSVQLIKIIIYLNFSTSLIL